MKDFRKYSKENIHFYGSNISGLLVDAISKRKPKKVADFGCGDGAVLFFLKQAGLLDNCKEIIAVDLSGERLERVKDNLKGVKTIKSDVTRVSRIKNNELDFVICSQVIEHIKNENLLLKELHRVLKKDGALFISSSSKKKYGFWIYRNNNMFVSDPTHVREYSSLDEFCNVIKSGGFKINSSNYYSHHPSLSNFVIRFLIKKNIISEQAARGKFFKHFLSKFKIMAPGFGIVEVVAVKK
jgi:ubiquinone/menaquinone biosynthesis C-methylase UbiE